MPNNPTQPSSFVNPTQPQNRPQGTGFTNLQSFIGANKNNQLGNAVGSGISNITGQAKTGLQQSQQQFQQGVNQANQQTQSDVQAATGALNQINQQNQLDQQSGSYDVSQYLPQGTQQSFQRLGSAQYGGPTQLNINQPLQSQISQAQALAQMAGSQNGSRGLLKTFVGGPNYTQGQQNLDSLLLGQTAAPQLAQAFRQGNNLQGQLQTAQSQAMTQAQAAQQGLQNAQQQVQGQAQQTEQQVQNQLNAQQQAQLAQQQALYNNLTGSVQNAQSTKQLGDLQNYFAGNGGPSNLQFLNKQDVLNSIGPFNANAITTSTAATGQDVARTNALQQLSGLLGKQYDFGLTPQTAGTNNQYLGLNNNLSQLQQAQAGRQQQYNSQATALQKQLEQATNQAKFLYGSNNPGGGYGNNTYTNLEKDRANATASRDVAQLALDKLQQSYNYGGLGSNQIGGSLFNADVLNNANTSKFLNDQALIAAGAAPKT